LRRGEGKPRTEKRREGDLKVKLEASENRRTGKGTTGWVLSSMDCSAEETRKKAGSIPGRKRALPTEEDSCSGQMFDRQYVFGRGARLVEQ